MSSNKTDEKSVLVPDKLKQGVYGDTINVSGVEISWDVRGGTCSFRGIPVAMMWVDSTLAGLMSGVQSMVGTERFNLALQAEGRKSVESDWLLISLYEDFAEGFAQLNLNAKVAGWGDWQLVAHNPERRECVFRAFNNWEGGYQKALGVYWGSGMLAGKLAGICGKLFDTNCWATQTRFVANGDPYDEFVVAPSERSLEQEIENLLGSDQATRADIAVALRRLQAAEEILRENEYRYNQLVRKIPDGIYTFQFATDGAMDFKYVSPRLCEILNLDAEAVMKNSRLAFAPVHPDDLDSLVRENDRVRVTLQPFRWEGRFLIHGDTRWIRISSDPTPLPDGGSLWHGVVSDITQSKQAEGALRVSHQILRDVLDTSLDGYWRADVSGRLLDVNPAYSHKSGYTREELLSMHISDLEALENAADTAEHIQRILADGSDRFETRHRRKDGSLWDVEISVTFSHLSDGCFVVFVRDITEFNKAKYSLLLQSEITANAAEGIALIRASDSRIHYTNHRFELLFGYGPGELIDLPISLINAPTEISPAEIASEINRRLEKNGVWSGEIQSLKKDGTRIWTYANISTFLHPELGKLWITHQSDLTDRKRADAELRIAATVFESQEAMVVTDAHSVILRINQAFTETTGYVAEDVIGQNPRILKSDRHDADFYREMWESIHRTGRWQGEVWDRRKNGEVYPKLLTISTVRNDKGNVTHYIGVHSDITERRQTRRLLADYTERLHELSSHLQTVREEERTHVARELHDELGQLLTALKMDISLLRTETPSSENSLARLESMNSLADEALGTIHRIASDLRPVMLDDLGLKSAVEWLVEGFRKRNCSIVCNLVFDLGDHMIDGEPATAAYRIVQECLTNIVRHAKASKVHIVIAVRKQRQLIISVQDNGCGLQDPRPRSGGFGLLGMRERANALGGFLTIESMSGEGVSVDVTIPLSNIEPGSAAK
jgi:PAS domain S-box-containing protein